MPSSRRTFLAAGIGGPALLGYAPAAPTLAFRTLGKTGLKVTSVAFGSMITSDGTVLERAADLVEPLRAALTPETRTLILELKALMDRGVSPHHPSIDVYRAVIDGGVRTTTELVTWLQAHPRHGLSFWRPGGTRR